MAGETNVGSIVGFLRLDATDWNQTLAQAGAAAEALGNSDPNINVNADTAEANAQLAATQAQADHLDGDDVSVDVHANTAQAQAGMASAERGMSKLIQAAILLGPALVPVGGAVAGLGLAFGGMGAAGVLAVVGVKNALKNGSEAGVEFQNGIDTLMGDLDLLAATAAGGILDGFSGAVSDLQGQMPELQNDVGALSTILGGTMRAGADGITNAFIALAPLMSDVAGYALRGAQAFDQWAQGDGLQKFGGYAAAVLPGVLHDIGQLVELAGKVVGAFSGWGGGVLSLLGTLASVLNSLPTGVFTVIANGGLAIYGAFKTFGLLQGLVSGFAGALGTMATNMGRLGASQAASRLQSVAGGLRSVGTAGSVASLAVGGIAAVLGVAMFAWSMFKQKQQEAKAAQEAMTQAIQEDSGALGENAQKVIAKTIADGNLVDKAKELGISTDTLASAFAGNADAIDEVNQKAHENGMVSKTASGAAKNLAGDQKRLSDSALDVTGSISKVNKEVKKGKSDFDANKLAAKALGDQLNTNTGELTSAELAHAHMGDAASDATGKIKEQNQAIQDLNQSLQEEISKQLQLQGGLTGEAAARQSMVETLKKTKRTTDLNTESGVKNRQSIESAVGQIQQYMQTQEKAGKTTAEATSTYKSQGAQLLDTIAHTDGANSATYKYAAQLLKLPKDVSTKVGTEGVGVSVSQLKGMQKVADALGVTRIAVPASTPNAKNVTKLLNNVSEAALSADQKSVSIKTDSPKAVVTKLKLKGIDDAAVSADKKSVTIPTKTLNQPRTVAQIREVLNNTKDKSMTVTARGNRLDAVLNKLGLIDRTGHSRSFTVQAFMVTTTIQKHVDERLNRGGGRPYASGTTSATAGLHLVGERGPELVIGPQVANLASGSIVLNHADTLRTLAGDPGPMMRATGANGGRGASGEIAALATQVANLTQLVAAQSQVPVRATFNVDGRELATAVGIGNRDRRR